MQLGKSKQPKHKPKTQGKTQILRLTIRKTAKQTANGARAQQEPQKICRDTVEKIHCVTINSKTTNELVATQKRETSELYCCQEDNKSRIYNTLLTNPASQSPLTSTFFSSSLADVALWLGPYMSISGKTSLCTRTKNGLEMQANHNNHNNTQPSQTTRKSPSQTCVSSRETTNQTNERGRSPNKNNHQKDLPKDTVV